MFKNQTLENARNSIYLRFKFPHLYTINSKIRLSYILTLKVPHLLYFNFLMIDFED